MQRSRMVCLMGVALGIAIAASWAGADQAPDLTGFKTVETAQTTTITKSRSAAIGQSGYLGVHVENDAKGRLAVTDVEIDSPAAKAGLQVGDVLVREAEATLTSAQAFRDLLQSKSPGDSIKLSVMRKDKPLEFTAVLGSVSRPMHLASERAILGLRVTDPRDDEGARVDQITNDGPAARAGLKIGDLIMKIDEGMLSASLRLNDALSDKKPGQTVSLSIHRDGKEMELKAKLEADAAGDTRGATLDYRAANRWKKDLLRLAVIGIEYPDVKHSDKIKNSDWEESLFSTKTYVNKNNATGQMVYGSMSDYYTEQSYGALRVEGKMLPWVEVSKKRGDYSLGSGTGGGNKTALLVEALEKLVARDGNDALKDFDAVIFLYAGGRVQTNRGAIYWPHRSSVSFQNKRVPYVIVPEGGSRMTNISVLCHETGHILGLPDLYARPENPGSEGSGVWTAMSNQVSNGRPQHFCAWCKEQLNWIKPIVIDPTVKQKIVLSPIEDSPKECIKVLVKADGSEYFLLENRQKKGFDASLPAQGLLIWRVVGNRPILEEAHGVEGPSGPRVYLSSVPFPSSANNSFTPYTIPTSRSQLGGGLPVYITNIRQLADGRITFYIGYDFE